MNKKIDFRKIGIAILGLFAILTALMRGSDMFPMPENTQTEQSTEQVVDNNANVEVVEFDLNTKEETGEKDHTKPRNVEDDSNPGNQRLTYEGKDLILTKHAKCRMNCRKVSNAEVMEVIKEGKENKRKSNPNDARCPTIALEDWTEDGQLVRIIVADCDNVAKLITVIDLKNEYDCYCK